MSESNHIDLINFPKRPENLDIEMLEYLRELERVLQEALVGSMYMNRVIEDGIIGN